MDALKTPRVSGLAFSAASTSAGVTTSPYSFWSTTAFKPYALVMDCQRYADRRLLRFLVTP